LPGCISTTVLLQPSRKKRAREFFNDPHEWNWKPPPPSSTSNPEPTPAEIIDDAKERARQIFEQAEKRARKILTEAGRSRADVQPTNPAGNSGLPDNETIFLRLNHEDDANEPSVNQTIQLIFPKDNTNEA
jgi:hypothetical protein